jgi:hypothetical protein
MSTYILKDVSIVPDIITVGQLLSQARDEKIAVMPEWLQRLRQTKVWKKKGGAKAKSYMYSFFNGNSLLTPFYIVKIEVLYDFIEKEWIREQNESVKKIYSEIKQDLSVKMSAGTKYILLDGQNRLYEAIKPFFDGTLPSNNYDRAFILNVDGKEVSLNNFKYTDIDLSQDIKDAFYNTQIVVAEGTDGDIQSYVNSIIDLNDGVSWTKFETSIIRMTPLNYLINRDIFHTPFIQNLFGNHALSGNVSKMTGAFEVEKKGDARFISELIYLIGNNCNSGVGTEDTLSAMLIESDQRFIHSYKRVKSYLAFISEYLNCMHNTDLKETEKPLCKESLRGLILLFDMMTNKTNVYYNHSSLKLKSIDDFESPKTIMEEFIKWHNEKTDKHSNPNDFKGKDPLPETYVHNTRGTSKENMYDRMTFINSDFLSVRANEWIAQSYIRENSADYKSLETVLKKKSNYIDQYSKSNPNIGLRSKIHIDHVKPRSKGGTDDINNLVVTNPKSNLIKSNQY